MANPQKEDGYTVLANELLEAYAKIRISGEASQILLVILRKTYGFNKKEDGIALSQFIESTGMSKVAVCKAIAKLESMNLVTVTKKGNASSVFKITKDYAVWKPLPKKVTLPKKVINVTKKVNQRYQKSGQQKKLLQKKERKGKNAFLQGDQWQQVIDIWEPVNPFFRDLYKNKTERKALDDMARLWGIQKLVSTIVQLESITSIPYAPKITKPSELKRDMGKLIAFYNQQKNKSKLKENNYVA